MRVFLATLISIFFVIIPRLTSAVTVTVTATVTGCGNGVIDVGEQCDEGNLGGASCVTLGFARGALSCSPSCLFTTSACRIGGAGGGGSSPGFEVSGARLVLRGRAYPYSPISILKDGQLIATTISDPEGLFSSTTSGLSAGDYLITVWASDQNNNHSAPFTFSIYITPHVVTQVSGIFLSPTVTTSLSSVTSGQYVHFSGQSVPGSDLLISVKSPKGNFMNIRQKVDPTGHYSVAFNTELLELGTYSVTAKASLDGEISETTVPLYFDVIRLATPEIPPVPLVEDPIKPIRFEKGVDITGDGRVNIIDFFVLRSWYGVNSPPLYLDLNNDRVITLVDFSILAYHWTG